MKKDYSKLKECVEKKMIKLENERILEKKRQEEYEEKYNDKYIEEKFSKFLDWLVDDIKEYQPDVEREVPQSFKDLLVWTPNNSGEIINGDINRYLSLRNLHLTYESTYGTRKIWYGLNTNSEIYFRKKYQKQLVDKFKEEVIINKPITSFPDEIHALQKRIRILEEVIKEKLKIDLLNI